MFVSMFVCGFMCKCKDVCVMLLMHLCILISVCVVLAVKLCLCVNM